tara:strand:- start:610 stop:1452 length:843 start_codon:yes stop_codon:yes gene_type:complete
MTNTISTDKDQPWQHSELGKRSAYKSQYDASLLFAIPRLGKREEIGLYDKLPFSGHDLWNAYELSWLNPKGKPQVAMAEFSIPAESPCIIESKSLKLYLNSLNDTVFSSKRALQDTIARDLSTCCQATVSVTLLEIDHYIINSTLNEWNCLDDLDISVDNHGVTPSILTTKATHGRQRWYSHLLKSNCLVTGQPDWGTVFIDCDGATIEPTSLLQYIISFRHHNEFHEQCVERMYVDILKHCQPKHLTVFARYTRRGGLDINPYRSNCQSRVPRYRLARQ